MLLHCCAKPCCCTHHSDGRVRCAEFWNTLTSVPLVAIGFYGIWRHHRTTYGLEPRFWFTFFAFVGVGVGSVLFHATLWRIGQVLDEIPMVWGNSAFIYTCITMEDKPGVRRDSLAAGTMLVTGIITVFYFNYPDAHAPFLFSYGLGVLSLVVLSFRMKQLPKECPPLMEISLCSYFFGLLLWVCERTFCSVVQPFQLHAMWHLFAGFGTYSECDPSPDSSHIAAAPPPASACAAAAIRVLAPAARRQRSRARLLKHCWLLGATWWPAD